MGMPSHPRSKTLIIWIVLISIVYLVASCGDDQEKTDSTQDVAGKVPQTPQVIVKEWYPRPKYPPPPTAYAPAPGPSAPSTGQPQPYYPNTYQQPQVTEQMPLQASPWDQSGQSQDMQQQYQTGSQYQTQQRPWGEFPPLEKKKKSTTRQEQRPVTIPYGGRQDYGGYGGYGGYGLSDPLLGSPGLGGGLYNAYPEMAPPVLVW
jgi:hypothetical protein